ncbi:nuclear transport factor 2 family protein [Rhizobium sp. LEGMi198b]
MFLKKSLLLVAATLLCFSGIAHSQEAVVPASDKEALFTSKDPILNANKQIVYHIVRDLIEANHWELADKYLSERYIQHNPNAKSGRDGVVYFFTKILKLPQKPIPDKIGLPVVFVSAEGDLVTVATIHTEKDPHDASKTYTQTWYDTWRIVDGKADEHWDSSPKF